MADVDTDTLGSIVPPVAEKTVEWEDTARDSETFATATEAPITSAQSQDSSQTLPIAGEFLNRVSSWNEGPAMAARSRVKRWKSPPPTQARTGREPMQGAATFASQGSGEDADGETDSKPRTRRMTTVVQPQTIFESPPESSDGVGVTIEHVETAPLADTTMSPPSTRPLKRPSDTLDSTFESSIPLNTSAAPPPQDTTSSSTVTLDSTRPGVAPKPATVSIPPTPPVQTTDPAETVPPLTSVDTNSVSPQSPPRKRAKVTAESPSNPSSTDPASSVVKTKDPPPDSDMAAKPNDSTINTITTDPETPTRPSSTTLPSTTATTDFATESAKSPKLEVQTSEEPPSTVKRMRKAEPLDPSSLVFVNSALDTTIPNRALRQAYKRTEVAYRTGQIGPPPLHDRSKYLLGVSMPSRLLPTDDDLTKARTEYFSKVGGLRERKAAEIERRVMASLIAASKPKPLTTPGLCKAIDDSGDSVVNSINQLAQGYGRLLQHFEWSAIPQDDGLRQTLMTAARQGLSYTALDTDRKRQLESCGLDGRTKSALKNALNGHALLKGASETFLEDATQKPLPDLRPPDEKGNPTHRAADRLRMLNRVREKRKKIETARMCSEADDGTQLASKTYTRKMWNGVVDLTDRTWASECEPQQYTDQELRSVALAAKDGAQVFAVMTDCDPTLITATHGLPTDAQLSQLGTTFKAKFSEANSKVLTAIYDKDMQWHYDHHKQNDGSTAFRASLAELREFHKKYRRYHNGPMTAQLSGGSAKYLARELDHDYPDVSEHLPQDSKSPTGLSHAAFDMPMVEARVGERLKMVADSVIDSVQDWMTEMKIDGWKPASTVRDALVEGITQSGTRDARSCASLAGPGKFLREVANQTLGARLKKTYAERLEAEQREARQKKYETLFAAMDAMEGIEETEGEEVVTETETAAATSESEAEDTAVETTGNETSEVGAESSDETAVESDGN